MLQTACGTGLRHHITDRLSISGRHRTNSLNTSLSTRVPAPAFSAADWNEGRLGAARARDPYESSDTLQYIRAARLPRLSSRGTRLLAHGAMDGRDAPTPRKHGIPGKGKGLMVDTPAAGCLGRLQGAAQVWLLFERAEFHDLERWADDSISKSQTPPWCMTCMRMCMT